MSLVKREIENFYNLKWLDNFLIGHNGIIAGGCFKNIFNKEPVKDIDVFFRNREDFIKAKMYFQNDTNSAGENNYYLYYENDKVIAFKQKNKFSNKEITIELVNTIFGEPEEILNAFDFTITKFAYYNERKIEIVDENINNPFVDEEKLIESKIITPYILHHDSFFEHLHIKRLVIDDRLPFPVSSFERMLRYIKYGYMPCKETKIRLLTEIREAENLDGISNSLYDGMD